jgi:peptidoglycan/LPS O-acetylase OafA/YrhL
MAQNSNSAPFANGPSAHRADIQGLRAVAVLSVVLYHADERLLPGGFAGVDIFFVISGFLITGILLRELQRGDFSIAGFYARRVRRLFPALFLMLAATLGVGAVVLDPDDYSELSRTAISTVFFVSNFDFYNLADYFAGYAANKPLLHTWTLAVEEQFYILYPLFLAGAWTLLPGRLASILAVGGLIAFGLSVWGVFTHPIAAFYLTPFRAFELCIGALAAVRPPSQRSSQVWRDAVSCIGALLIASSFLFLNSSTPFPGLAALPPCLGAALIIHAGDGGRTLAGRALSFPVLTFFGAISYSLYLWHWPALALARNYLQGAPAAWQVVLLIAVSILIATASWRWVERPLLTRPAPRRTVLAMGAAAMACTSAFAALILISGGLPSRFSPSALALFAGAEDHNRLRRQCHSSDRRYIAYADNCTFGAPGVTPIAAVWGDSAGAELVVALGDVMARRGQAVMQITASGCPPALDYQLPEQSACIAYNRTTLDHLVRDDRLSTVIVALNFTRYSDADQPRVRSGLTRSVEALAASGKVVVLVYPFPNLWFQAPTVLGFLQHRGQPLDPVGIPYAQHERENHDAIAFLDALADRTGAVPFRPAEALCSRSFCPAYQPGIGVLYFNHNHVSVAGARVALSHFPFEVFPAPDATPPSP